MTSRQVWRSLNDPDVGTTLELSVSGIGTDLDGVAVDDGYEPVAAWIGPALYESLGEPSAGYGGAAVRLTDPRRLAEFKAAVDAMVPDESIVYQTLEVTQGQGAPRHAAGGGGFGHLRHRSLPCSGC